MIDERRAFVGEEEGVRPLNLLTFDLGHLGDQYDSTSQITLMTKQHLPPWFDGVKPPNVRVPGAAPEKSARRKGASPQRRARRAAEAK